MLDSGEEELAGAGGEMVGVRGDSSDGCGGVKASALVCTGSPVGAWPGFGCLGRVVADCFGTRDAREKGGDLDKGSASAWAGRVG